MPRTKIVCTIGPASQDEETLRRLIAAGMDVARLNFSHGDHAAHAGMIERIRAAAQEAGRAIAILADLQGPKLRVGEMAEEGVLLQEEGEVTFVIAHVVGQSADALPVQYQDLPRLVKPGDRMLLDDGLLEVRVLAATPDSIRCRVVAGGILRSNKGINLPHVAVDVPAVTPKDRVDLAFALEQGVDWIALSFVRTRDDVAQLKAFMATLGTHPSLPVIAKIEKPEAVENLEGILQVVDGVMVARGDLGIEIGPEMVPMAQKRMIRQCNQQGLPVITATQMLESMVHNPRPTRAEASDVANAVLDGTDALMLSEETAIGAYPVEAVQTMDKIAREAEVQDPRLVGQALFVNADANTLSVADAVSRAACETAHSLRAAAIVTPTVSGYTARLIARHRPEMPIIAVTPNVSVQRQLALSWGVIPLLAPRTDDTDEMIEAAVRAARAHGLIQPGDSVVVTAGAAGSLPGTTNLMRVLVV